MTDNQGAATPNEARLAEENARMRDLLRRVPNIVSYVTATLASATNDPTAQGAEWGKVHRGRAHSSIQQLKGLEKKAREVLGDE